MTMPARPESSTWVRNRRPSPGATTRLIALPHAGGSASYYLPLLAPLWPQVEVLAVQYPGRQDRLGERPISDLHVLADRIAEELQPWTDLPYALFGHSFGATVGYEVALRLARSGRVPGPSALYVSGSPAPSARYPREKQRHLMSDEALLADLRELSGTELSLLDNEQITGLMLPALRGDYRARETYRPRRGPLLDIPVSALLGDSDPRVDPAEACSWRDHTTDRFDVTFFRGGHFYLTQRAGELIDLIGRRQASIAPAVEPPSAPVTSVFPGRRGSTALAETPAVRPWPAGSRHSRSW